MKTSFNLILTQNMQEKCMGQSRETKPLVGFKKWLVIQGNEIYFHILPPY